MATMGSHSWTEKKLTFMRSTKWKLVCVPVAINPAEDGDRLFRSPHRPLPRDAVDEAYHPRRIHCIAALLQLQDMFSSMALSLSLSLSPSLSRRSPLHHSEKQHAVFGGGKVASRCVAERHFKSESMSSSSLHAALTRRLPSCKCSSASFSSLTAHARSLVSCTLPTTTSRSSLSIVSPTGLQQGRWRRRTLSNTCAQLRPIPPICLSTRAVSTMNSKGEREAVEFASHFLGESATLTPTADLSGENHADNDRSSPSIVFSLIEALQQLCLPAHKCPAEGGDADTSAPLWQQCLSLCVSAGQSSARAPSPLTDASVVSFLDSTANCATFTDIGEPEDVNRSEKLRITSPLVTEEQALCILDWLLYGCVTSHAPVPVTTAVYQATRALHHRQVRVSSKKADKCDTQVVDTCGEGKVAESNGDAADLTASVMAMVDGAGTCAVGTATATTVGRKGADRDSLSHRTALLKRRVPWQTKGLHTRYARYLLNKYHDSVSSTLHSHGNLASLALFEAFFTCLLLDSAADAQLNGETRTGARGRFCGSLYHPRTRTLATSAALQLLLLEGSRQFLAFVANYSDPTQSSDNDTVNRAMRCFPTLSWLMETEPTGGASIKKAGRERATHGGLNGTQQLPRLAQLADACIPKLAHTNSLQDGLLLYSALLAHMCRLQSVSRRHDQHTVSFLSMSSRSSAATARAGVYAHGLVEQERMLRMLSATARSFNVGTESATMTEMFDMGMDIAVNDGANGVGEAVRACEETLARVALTTTVPRGISTSQQSTTPHTPVWEAHEGLDALLRALEVISPFSVHDTSSAHLWGRALLLPLVCTERSGSVRPSAADLDSHSARPHPKERTGSMSTSQRERHDAPLIAWILTVHLREVTRTRDAVMVSSTHASAPSEHGSPPSADLWAAATAKSLASLQTIARTLEQAMAHWRRHQPHGRSPQVKRAVQQLRQMERGMQVFWLLILRAAYDGVFASQPTSMKQGHHGGALSPHSALADRTAQSGAILHDLVLPFYTPRYWQAGTVNVFVALLDNWGLSKQLRHVMATVQRHEERAQAKVWHQIRSAHQQLDTDAYNNSGNEYGEEQADDDAEVRQGKSMSEQTADVRRRVLYRPALTLASCEIILRQCTGTLEDPHTAAMVVKYMILSLRTQKLKREWNHFELPPSVSRGNDTHVHAREQVTDPGKSMASENDVENEEASEIMMVRRGQHEEEEEQAWLKRIVTTHIPNVNELFSRKGIANSHDWLED